MAAAAVSVSRPDVCALIKPREQWVERIIGYSSQYDDTSYSANVVIGRPQVYPKYGDHPNAWAQENRSKEEYIEVGFQDKVYIERVDIYETYYCGAVVRVKAQDQNDRWHTLWKADAPQRLPKAARIFTPDIQLCNFPCNVLRLELDCTAEDSPQWCEIDAIKIYGKTSNLVPPPPSALGESLKALVNSKNFSDVVFEVEGETFYGHRNILSTRSTFFAALLYANPDPKEPIPVTKLSVPVFLGVLQYLYTGAIDYSVTDIQLVQIAQACRFLALPELAILCESYIQVGMTVNNIIPILIEASKPDGRVESIRDICFAFCRDNFAEVSRCEDFHTLPKELMVELVQKATANLSTK